jgi:hypothetical protein
LLVSQRLCGNCAGTDGSQVAGTAVASRRHRNGRTCITNNEWVKFVNHSCVRAAIIVVIVIVVVVIIISSSEREREIPTL